VVLDPAYHRRTSIAQVDSTEHTASHIDLFQIWRDSRPKGTDPAGNATAAQNVPRAPRLEASERHRRACLTNEVSAIRLNKWLKHLFNLNDPWSRHGGLPPRRCVPTVRRRVAAPQRLATPGERTGRWVDWPLRDGLGRLAKVPIGADATRVIRREHVWSKNFYERLL
jgi:hypothetical protein